MHSCSVYVSQQEMSSARNTTSSKLFWSQVHRRSVAQDLPQELGQALTYPASDKQSQPHQVVWLVLAVSQIWSSGAAPGCDSNSHSLSKLAGAVLFLTKPRSQQTKLQVCKARSEYSDTQAILYRWVPGQLYHTYKSRGTELQHKPEPDLKLIPFIHRETSSLLVHLRLHKPEKKSSSLSFR